MPGFGRTRLRGSGVTPWPLVAQALLSVRGLLGLMGLMGLRGLGFRVFFLGGGGFRVWGFFGGGVRGFWGFRVHGSLGVEGHACGLLRGLRTLARKTVAS